MGGREASDRDTEGGARHIVQAECVAQFDARWIAAMLSANPDLELLADLPAFLDTHPHELADTFAIQRLEGIEGQDSPVHEIEEELAFRVVTGISKRGLREIVRPEGEELRVLRDLVRRESCPRELDHRPEFV